MTLLGVGGPTGAGKSTLGRIIAGKARGQFLPEPFPKEALEAFRLEPVQNGSRLQRAFIMEKLAKYRAIKNAAYVVMDRTIAEDREVFTQMHYRLGFITAEELPGIQALSHQAESEIGSPNALIYLTAEERILKSRMISDGRPPWLIECLAGQLSLYERFFKSLSVPRLRIDSTHLELCDLEEIAQWIVETLPTSEAPVRKDGTAIRFNLQWITGRSIREESVE
jgi:deoxyadenosine/deoxycytidine kinase